jgi:hypothetical protein
MSSPISDMASSGSAMITDSAHQDIGSADKIDEVDVGDEVAQVDKVAEVDTAMAQVDMA